MTKLYVPARGIAIPRKTVDVLVAELGNGACVQEIMPLKGVNSIVYRVVRGDVSYSEFLRAVEKAGLVLRR